MAVTKKQLPSHHHKAASPHCNKAQHLPALTLFQSIKRGRAFRQYFPTYFEIKSSFIKSASLPLMSPSVVLFLPRSCCRGSLISTHTLKFLEKVKSAPFPNQCLKNKAAKPAITFYSGHITSFIDDTVNLRYKNKMHRPIKELYCTQKLKMYFVFYF